MAKKREHRTTKTELQQALRRRPRYVFHFGNGAELHLRAKNEDTAWDIANQIIHFADLDRLARRMCPNGDVTSLSLRHYISERYVDR